MGTTSRLVQAGVLAGLFVTSVRPIAPIEAALEHVIAPVRILSELVRPMSVLSLREVRAAEARLRELEDAEFDARRELHEDGRAFALPSEPGLAAGRRFVPAEVIERSRSSLDRIVVALESGHAIGIEPGLPVVSGNVYVGRVAEVDVPRPGQATVELVTGAGFFVGAVLEPDDPEAPGLTGEPLRMVVGGIPADERGDVRLAVHNPVRRDLPDGSVRVEEGVAGIDPFARLAEGYELGRLEGAGGRGRSRSRPRLGVEPLVDYKAGLHQLCVLLPADSARPPETPEEDLLFDGRWRGARPVSIGDPNGRRDGLVLGAGTWNGVRPGAAVLFGVRLIGRIQSAGPLASRASLLGDPGLSVPAVARIEGREEPLALGRLLSLGRAAGEEHGRVVYLHWEALEKLAADGSGPARATLFTGSGDALVPRGLVLGEALLPRGPGPHVIALEQPADTRRVRTLWVRLPGELP